MSLQEELLFDLIESEALVNVYLDDAKVAAIIVTGSPVGHFPKEKGHKVTLWFGRGVLRETFKTKKEAYEKAFEILDHATRVMKIEARGQDAKRFTKALDKHRKRQTYTPPKQR